MAILGDFEEFEGPVPEPPYPYHQVTILSVLFYRVTQLRRNVFVGWEKSKMLLRTLRMTHGRWILPKNAKNIFFAFRIEKTEINILQKE